MNTKLNTKEGIRELQNFWGNRYGVKESYPITSDMKLSFKDFDCAIKQFISEHGKPDKKNHMTFRCQGWPDTWRRRGIGFATNYPYLSLKRPEKRYYDKKYKYYNYDFSVRRLSIINDKIVVKLFVKHPEFGNEFEFTKEFLDKYFKKEQEAGKYYWLLYFLENLHHDAENNGRFFWHCCGLNGTPDSIVCAGQKNLND